MGFRIRNAVRQCMLALYINALSPVNDTIRVPISTSFAPNAISSSANTSSSSAIVLAIMGNDSPSLIVFPSCPLVRTLSSFNSSKRSVSIILSPLNIGTKIGTIYDLKFRNYYNLTLIFFAFDSFQKASNAVTTYVYRFEPPS